ncbi:MAG TPA: triple tyrosine motif-containing protein, partial [Candidatus Dojkabacteria bacterium]|nr:triple tyrosine motif-containing protein [Candidatus Dojkabacteria bacterium]
NRFNPGNNSFTRYNRETLNDAFIDDWVYTIHEDQKGNFWVGTAAGGLNLFDRDKESFTHFRNDPHDSSSISNNRVLSLLETRSGDIWIGTALGLNKLINPKKDRNDFSFNRYYQSDGLPNDVIYGILEDDSGNLWISTNNGLCKIIFEADNFKVRKFDVTDGLQANEFDQNSFCKGPGGKMYFGGINGFNVFHPDSVKDNPYIPPVVITDFKILNESVPIANKISVSQRNSYLGSFFLNKSISETDTILLSYRDDVISIEFAALNYTVPEKNQYAYMMEGFDKEWIYSGVRRFVTYTNLDAGQYVFRVMASNNDGVWNEEGTSLTIIVFPPPW